MSTALLILFAVILFFVILFLVAKATELAAFGTDEKESMEKSSNLQAKLLMAFLIIGLLAVVYSFYTLYPRMLPESASIHGDWVDSMFNITSLVALIVFIGVHIVLISFVFKYRYKKDGQAYFFSHSNKLEIIWTVGPAVVLLFLSYKGLSAWDKIFDFKSLPQEKGAIHEIETTAKQFGWIIRYPGVDGKFGERIIDKEHISTVNELGINWEDEHSKDDFMADELVLVQGKPTYMILGAQDVLHSFYLPHFRVKMDCVPGMPTRFMFTPKYTTEQYKEEVLKKNRYWQQIDPETGNPKWQDFTFELACAELCGKSHFAMRREVKVVTQEEYDAWVKQQESYYETVIAAK